MNNLMRHPQFPVAVLVVFSCFWGLSWLPLKYLHSSGFNGVPITLFVYLVMFMVSLPFIYHFRHSVVKSWKILLATMILGGGAQLAFNSSMIYGDVIRAMVLFYMVPLWGVLGGRVFLGEKITSFRWIGMGMSVIGAFLVVGGMNAFVSPPTWIDALALLSGFLFAMNNIAFRASPDVPVMLKLPFMFLGAVILSGLVVVQMGEPVIPDVPVSVWLVLLAYGAIWMMLANLGTQWAVTQMESGRSSIILILELITAVVSASLILGETMTSIEMVGGVFILIAALLETVPQKKTDDVMNHNDIKSAP